MAVADAAGHVESPSSRQKRLAEDMHAAGGVLDYNANQDAAAASAGHLPTVTTTAPPAVSGLRRSM